MHTFIFNNKWALGDTVCLSALVRDLHRAYPGQYRVLLAQHYQSYWKYLSIAKALPDNEQAAVKGQVVQLEYLSGIRAAGNGSKSHFLAYWHRAFENATGLRVPCTEPKGVIGLAPEAQTSPYPFRYWVVVAGGKHDATVKVWYTHRYQQAVDTLQGLGLKFVQAGADFNKHFHPRLQRVEQSIGKTDDIQDFFRLIYHAEGVLCGVTGAMHIAAVFDKPCVVVAGGREEPWWEAYTNCYFPESFGPACAPVKVEHTFLHTLGLLDCGCGNLNKGCWRDRTVPIERTDHSNAAQIHKLCKRPIRDAPQAVPECMHLIEVDHVVEAVMNYYEKGILPPIGKPTRKYAEAITLDYPMQPLVGTPKAPNPIKELWDKSVASATPIDLAQERERHKIRGIGTNITPLLRDLPPLPREATHLMVNPPTLRELEKWGREMPREVQSRVGEDPDLAVLDHPYIGGKFTVFVLGYGEHLALVKRCLGSILDNAPSARIDLRVALNQPSKPMLDYITGFDKKTVTRVYLDHGDRRKYPAMREMFWDDSCPIETKYVLWFDDDSHVVDKKWLVELGHVIVGNHPHGSRMFGCKYIHDLMGFRRRGFAPEKWFQAARWWQSKPLHLAKGARTGPNGSEIVFASGGFWALATEVIRKADIPDARLNHNGGDITIGAQVHQAGFKVCDFARGKKPVCWSDAQRRGYHEAFPWSEVT